ncbi:MAG TPA: exodeoxyribonuclease III [Candidatus Nanoarchaeia archaeon]|nr:exodeoxyribonuclease III [Candidatus Nanoarchaeia archaeon]
MKLISWNVNGIRAVLKKGFDTWLKKEHPDVLCLQETKIDKHEIHGKFDHIEGYHMYFNSGKKKGYAGVATFSKEKLDNVTYGLDLKDFEDEGRVVITDHKHFLLLNIYFPNSGRGHDRVKYKLEFCDKVLQVCEHLRKQGKKLVICGDYNIAHEELDLKNPKQNHETAGFLPEERAWMTKFLSKGYIDIFRKQHPGEEGYYTWWTYRFQARQRNIGWRVDYFCITPDLEKHIKQTKILKDVMGSDHCPVLLEFDYLNGK